MKKFASKDRGLIQGMYGVFGVQKSALMHGYNFFAKCYWLKHIYKANTLAIFL